MFNELKSILLNANNLLELWLALFFIVASTLVCIVLAKRLGRDCSALGGALWGLTKAYSGLAWANVITIYERWLVCRAWRNAMIHHSLNQSLGIVWKFHRSLSGVLWATGTTDYGAYIIEAGRQDRTDPKLFFIRADMKFEPRPQTTGEMVREEIMNGITYKNDFELTGTEKQELGISMKDYLVNKLCVAVKDAMQQAECHAWDIAQQRLEDEVVWEWEESVFSTGGRSTRRVFTCGGYDCYYDVESIESEFTISATLTLQGQGRKSKFIASLNEQIKSLSPARSQCVRLEDEMKQLARERNDANMDSEFNEAIDDAPTPLEYLAGQGSESPAEPPVEHEPALDGEGDEPIVDNKNPGVLKLVSVRMLAEKYDLPLSEVGEKLVSGGFDMPKTTDILFAKLDDVKGLFEHSWAGKTDNTIPKNSGLTKDEQLEKTNPVPDDQSAEGELLDWTCVGVEFLSERYNLSKQEVRERLIADGRDAPVDHRAPVDLFGNIKHIFAPDRRAVLDDQASMEELEKKFGKSALGLLPLHALEPSGHCLSPDGRKQIMLYSMKDTERLLVKHGILIISADDIKNRETTDESLMTEDELAGHFLKPLSTIYQVLNGVEPAYVSEMGLVGGKNEPQIKRWQVGVVRQLLANLEKSNEPAS